MNQPEIFQNPEFGSIRVIEEDGMCLFGATDVAMALGYSNPRKAIRDHTKGGTKRSSLTTGGNQTMIFIPEGDVYRLIVHSKLPSAERFERWIFDEVLPTIRRHGAYMTQDRLQEGITSPELLMKLCAELIEERQRQADSLQARYDELIRINGELEIKALYFDTLVDMGQCTNLRTTAKLLAVPERKFIRFLLGHRYIYRTASGALLPYASQSNAELFCVKDYLKHNSPGTHTLITPTGKLYFYGLRPEILLTI